MANFTSKLNLEKPLGTENYDVGVFNSNADIIDSQIYSKSEVDTFVNNKVDKFFATNLITNGDFSNGTTGWLNIVGTVSVNNGRLVINTSSGISVQQMLNVINENQYYTAFKIKSDGTASVAISLRNGVTNVSPLITTNVALNNFQIQSQIIIATGVGDRLNIARNSTTSNVVELDDFIIIDLTTLFGSGNEPTKEQMDLLLSVYPNSWFNGTSEIGSIGALIRATLGAQVVTPTLLNSRTGTAQYVVSKDGFVVFRGTASGGSLNTNIFVLPENIRPIATRTFTISANNAFGVITVGSNGEVRQTVGALTNVFLDGIVFKVGM